MLCLSLRRKKFLVNHIWHQTISIEIKIFQTILEILFKCNDIPDNDNNQLYKFDTSCGV